MHDLTGVISNIAISYATGKPLLTLEVNEDKSTLQGMYEELKTAEKLSIKIGEESEKRSTDANSYYWLLLNRLAKAIRISKPYCHNLMLRRYGTFDEFDGQTIYWVIPDTDEASKQADEAEKYHIKPTSQVREGKNGLMYRTYILLKGSHDYTKKEFSQLLEGLVDECRLLGIETKSKEEIDSLLSSWRDR